MPTTCLKCNKKMSALGNYGTIDRPLCFECSTVEGKEKKLAQKAKKTGKMNPNPSLDHFLLGSLLAIPLLSAVIFQNIAFLNPIIPLLLCSYIILKKPFSQKMKFKPSREKIFAYGIAILSLIGSYSEILRNSLIAKK
jgi:hypothetical protein